MAGFGLAVVGISLFLAPFSLAQSPLQFDTDVPVSLKSQVLSDIAWASQIEGSKATPLHQEIFGPIHGGGYAQWVAKRVFFFGVDACGGGGSVACVKSKYKNKIFVTNQYVKGNYPQVARLMTIYHEARHTEFENGMWAHTKCPSNFPYRSIWTGNRLAGNSSCDPSEYGSYASASILLNNWSRFCTNCNEKVRADSKTYADDQIKRVVGKTPMARIQSDFAFQ